MKIDAVWYSCPLMDKSIRLIKVERVDDIPVLLEQLRTMQVAALLDELFPTHGHWKGELTSGEVVAVWLTFVLSEGDHCLSHVQPWVEEHLETLSACLGKCVRPLDVHDDRLADILDALSEAALPSELFQRGGKEHPFQRASPCPVQSSRPRRDL